MNHTHLCERSKIGKQLIFLDTHLGLGATKTFASHGSTCTYLLGLVPPTSKVLLSSAFELPSIHHLRALEQNGVLSATVHVLT